MEVNLNADYRYNPLYNDLDAYALAYNIASLLNNLFGKGKEPFWQQAYTNLVKFIIQLHKVAYDYVTLFDVYECAINPELLEKRIHEAEQLVRGRHYFVVSDSLFRSHPELERFHFVADEPARSHKALQSAALEEVLKAENIDYESQVETSPGSGRSFEGGDSRRRETLVLSRLAANRKQTANLNRRRDLRLPLSVRRQPDGEAHVLSTEGVLRLETQRGWTLSGDRCLHLQI